MALFIPDFISQKMLSIRNPWCCKMVCKVEICPDLKIFLTLRSASDSKNVHFHAMTENYGYMNFYEIAAITQYLGFKTTNVI